MLERLPRPLISLPVCSLVHPPLLSLPARSRCLWLCPRAVRCKEWLCAAALLRRCWVPSHQPPIHPINHRALGRLALRRRCCLRLTVLCAGSLPRAGHIPTPIVNLGTGIVSFIEGELTEIVDRRRVATVADDLKAVAGQIVAGVLHYDTIVRLIGGRPPSNDGEDLSEHAAGCFGEPLGETWQTDVPLAMGHLGTILGTIYGEGLGCTLGLEEGFGLQATARRAVAEGLSAENTRKLFVHWFKEVAYQMQCLRTSTHGTPDSRLPDWVGAGLEARRVKLTPAVRRQTADAAAAGAGAAAGAAAALQALADGSAGVKRDGSGRLKKALALAPSPSPSPAPATPAKSSSARRREQRAAAKAAAAAATGTTPAQAPTPATAPAPSPAPAPAPSPAPAPPGAPAWAPTWAAGSITRLNYDKANPDVKSAVMLFNHACRNEFGLGAAMPCAIAALTGTCHGPPQCRTCGAQATRTPPTPTPAGLVARVKAACDANTAQRIV